MKKPKSDGATAAPRAAAASDQPAPPIQDHDLEDSIPYLLARAGSRMGLAFTQELKQFQLTLTEGRVCIALHHLPGQRLSELAAHTASDTSTLSRNVDHLIARGLVRRAQSSGDGRALALSLTSSGSEMAARIIPLAQLYERVALGGISPADVEGLRAMLRRLYENIALLERQR